MSLLKLFRKAPDTKSSKPPQASTQLERPAPIDESIDTVEGLNKQVEGLKAEAKAADEAASSPTSRTRAPVPGTDPGSPDAQTARTGA